jgi:tetratricopeptide (TPR) repeat protein
MSLANASNDALSKHPNTLLEWIKRRHYKVKALADKTDIPIRTLWDYIAGRVLIPEYRLERLAECLSCRPEQLLPTLFLWNVPHQRNPFFTGREALLQQIHEALNRDNAVALTHPQAISGLGGIGKTQTVIEYAYRYHHDYEAVFWVKADTRQNILSDFVSIAALLSLSGQDGENLETAVSSVMHWLNTHTKWLLIFDNADNLAILREFIPPGFGGHILLTTRAQSMGRLAHRIEVEIMSPEVGTLFLLRRASIITPDALPEQASVEDRFLALQIVQELGGLPLALDQAGAYIEESSYHLEGYLQLYQNHRAMLLKRRGGLATDHPEPVATTWLLSFQQVEQTDPLAAELLRLCAFLDPDAIPEEILMEGAQDSVSQQESVSPDQLRVNAAIEVLLRFSLIQRNSETRTLTIHRLVQAAIQDTMNKDTQYKWAEIAVKAVKRAFPYASNTYSASGYPNSAVQLLRASIHIDQERGDKESIATALWNLAVQQQVLGRLSASEQSLAESLSLCKNTHDMFNEAKTHQYLALLRAYQGEFEASSQHLGTALSLFKEINAIAPESAVWAYRALCGLLTGDISSALVAARYARELSDTRKEERDIIRAEWLLGWTFIRQASLDNNQLAENLQEAEQHLKEALHRCRQINMVDYEADLLLALARLHHVKGDRHQAKIFAKEALVITNRSDFRMLRADINNLLARLELEDGNQKEAINHAQAAFHDAFCDGPPYCYKSALEEAKYLLDEAR